ncbi:MAG: hypothetical protein IJY24_06370, partial [Clostridia bacterium]|nr:hypothetical protein [Clostridia bacterium]
MNKFRKILCAVLVLAVLCSALALVVNADPVTPTVTVVQNDADTTAIATAGIASYEGNSLAASLAWAHNEKVDAYIITENGDEDPYVGLVVAPGQTGAVGVHVQHTLMPGSNPTAIKNDGWSVIEIDMATQSSMITGIGIAPVNRNSKGATTAAFSQAVTLGSYVNLTSDWTRITVVQDFSNNVQYLYVNGAYAGKVGYAYNGTVLPEDYTGDAEVETVGLFDYGFKLEISTANIANEGQSVMYDNASRRTFTAQEATDNGLVALMATPETADLNSWGIKGVGRTGSLPVVAKYNGVEYNNVSKLAAATYGQVGVVVEALGENAQYVLATNNMTVNTNGMKFGVATRAGGSVTENADGTLTVVSPFVESSTDGPVIVSSDDDMKSVVATIKNTDSNNKFSKFQNNITEANFMNAWITTNTLDQVSYLNVTTSDYEGKSQSKNPDNGQLWWGNAYFEIQSWGTFNYDETKNQFVVFDFDFALLTNGSVGTMPVPREGSSGLWGANNTNISSWASGFPLGEFHHYTFAFDLNNNVLYTYVDGALVETDDTGYTTAASHSNVFRAGKTLAFNGLRIGSATADAADYAINSIRILHVSEDAEGFGSTSLSQAVKGTKIDTWENSITETITAIAPIATIDNQPYYSVAAMNEALVGEEPKVVNILKAFKSELVVDTNATIYTNGLNVTVVAGAVANEPVKDGDVITVEIPYVPSASEIVAANGLAGVATDVPGNIITSGGALVNNVTDNFNAYVVDDGNREYIKFVAPADGLTATNSYVQFENGNVDLPLDGYYVIDLEVATESSLLNFSINPIARNTSPVSGKSNFPFGTSVYLQPLAGPSDEWAHITIVGDMAANKEYIFINGELVNANYGAAYAAGDNYHGGKLSAKGVRVNIGQKVGYRGGESFLFDNLSYRIFTASEKTAIDTALATKTTNNWTNSLYKGSNDKLPALVEIDGVPYGNVYTASEALCKEYENVVNAEFRKNFIGTITIGTPAIVDTNGIGTYKVVTGAPVETEVEGEMAIIYAPFACEVDGEIVTVTKLTEENVYDFATSVYWCYGDINDDIYSEYETVYYPAGTAITYYGN